MRLAWALSLVILASDGSAPVRAEEPQATRALKGIKSFRVVVEKLGSQVERQAALHREDLQADVEQVLAQAGIPVSKDAPTVFYVNLAVVCGAAECAFNAALEVQQKVRVESGSKATLIAPTWRTSGMGLVARRSDLIRRNLREQVGQFVAAYRAANPAKKQDRK
jgi:hypothetical protein